MNENEIKLMESVGFFLVPEVSVVMMGDSLWFERNMIHPNDIHRAINALAPHHFQASSTRGAYVAHMYADDPEKSFWYITSNLRGDYRGYKCRNVTQDFDTANIFGSGKTFLDAATAFVENYKTWVE